MAADSTHEYLLKVERLKELLVERATGGEPATAPKEYADLRRELVKSPTIREALPEFVRRCTTIREFWGFIKDMFETEKYRRRTEYLQREFAPIMSWLEGGSHPVEAKSRSTSGKETGMIKVLLLSANPLDDPLGIDGEFRAIDAKIRGADHRDHIQLINHGAVRLEDVPGLLMRHKPHIVHFSGHGNVDGIALTTADGSSKVVPPNALANIFNALKDNVRVVLLNACDSEPQAEAIVSVIDCAVGMADEIDDDAAVAFAAAFYEALGYGRSVETAFEVALVLLTGAGEDQSLAKLHKRRGVKPSVTSDASAGGRAEVSGVASDVSGRVVPSKEKEWLYSNLLKVTLPERIYIANTASFRWTDLGSPASGRWRCWPGVAPHLEADRLIPRSRG